MSIKAIMMKYGLYIPLACVAVFSGLVLISATRTLNGYKSTKNQAARR